MNARAITAVSQHLVNRTVEGMSPGIDNAEADFQSADHQPCSSRFLFELFWLRSGYRSLSPPAMVGCNR